MSVPLIYSVAIPIIVADLWIEIYHRICFRLYGLPRIRRREYIKIDRQKLSYLDWMQKLNCMYCGYVNGLFAYWVRIGGDTEAYWCGIKHRESHGFHVPEHHKTFLKYNDKHTFESKFKKHNKKF